MIAVCLRSRWTLDWVRSPRSMRASPATEARAHLRHFLRVARAARRLMREG